jgi:hypothetical protein
MMRFRGRLVYASLALLGMSLATTQTPFTAQGGVSVSERGLSLQNAQKLMLPPACSLSTLPLASLHHTSGIPSPSSSVWSVCTMSTTGPIFFQLDPNHQTTLFVPNNKVGKVG